MALITLRVLDGADRGRIYENLPTPVTIGREEGNTIQLNDERVSRFHLKIQDDRENVVLTDLESTNGTKVNGEDIHLRILRHGDMVAVGRSVLLFGTPRQIAQRLAVLRGDERGDSGANDPHSDVLPVDPDPDNEFDMAWRDDSEIQQTLHTLQPPELPHRLSPGQAAELSELLEYLHVRIRDLLASVKVVGPTQRITLDAENWQHLLDLQGRLAGYLRSIGEPEEPR